MGCVPCVGATVMEGVLHACMARGSTCSNG